MGRAAEWGRQRRWGVRKGGVPPPSGKGAACGQLRSGVGAAYSSEGAARCVEAAYSCVREA